MLDGLSERKERILKAVVEEYTRNARPVASETLLREYGMSVSSATIRNEMAELEAEGYIYQPHTSAGRIPSEQGYRYFVQPLDAGGAPARGRSSSPSGTSFTRWP